LSRTFANRWTLCRRRHKVHTKDTPPSLIQPIHNIRLYLSADELRAEYDFSNGVRGKHHVAYKAGTNVVVLDPDVAEAFPDASSVNGALRLLMDLAKKQLSKESA
jgi:hypothetical protein